MNDMTIATQLDYSKLGGLVPAVIQDASTGVVLMVGFMNREAVERTLNERLVTFWSRSRQQLWQKGETSGNKLDVVSVTADCDNDSLLVVARPRGPVCHTGIATCFGDGALPAGTVLARLQAIIAERKRTMPEGSYTTRLFADGPIRMAQKIGEEGVEVALAASQGNSEAIKEESADLLYHLLVMLQQQGIQLEEVESVLRSRMK